MPRRRSDVDRTRIDQLADQQAGLITYAQLSRLELPPATLAYWTKTGGPWRRVLPGVYLTNRGSPTEHQRALAALLYAGAGAQLTGTEALRRHGFLEANDGQLHVLIPHHARRRSVGFVVIERTTRLPEPVRRRGLPCAPVSRAVLDACRRATVDRPVRALIAEAVQRGYCGVDELAAELRDGPIRGSRLARLALEEVADGVRSVAEGEGRRLILASDLPAPRWNVDLVDADGKFIARPDAWWEDVGVALEIDSKAWHTSPADWERTLERHMRMAAVGIIVLHVAPRRLVTDGPRVVAEIRGALAAAAGRARPQAWSRSTEGALESNLSSEGHLQSVGVVAG